MVSITQVDDNIKIEVKGLHKLWAFRNELTLPKSHIKDAYQDSKQMSGWKGWRMPGTHVSFLITACTYY